MLLTNWYQNTTKTQVFYSLYNKNLILLEVNNIYKIHQAYFSNRKYNLHVI